MPPDHPSLLIGPPLHSHFGEFPMCVWDVFGGNLRNALGDLLGEFPGSKSVPREAVRTVCRGGPTLIECLGRIGEGLGGDVVQH